MGSPGAENKPPLHDLPISGIVVGVDSAKLLNASLFSYLFIYWQ